MKKIIFSLIIASNINNANAQSAPETSVAQNNEQSILSSKNEITDISLTSTSSTIPSSPEPVIDPVLQKIREDLADIRDEQQVIGEKATAIAAVPFSYAVQVALLARLIQRLDPLLTQAATLPGAQIPQPNVFGKLTLEQELRKEKAIMIAKQAQLAETFREAIKKYAQKRKAPKMYEL